MYYKRLCGTVKMCCLLEQLWVSVCVCLSVCLCMQACICPHVCVCVCVCVCVRQRDSVQVWCARNVIL